MSQLDAMIAQIEATSTELREDWVYFDRFGNILSGLKDFGKNIYTAFDLGFQNKWLEEDRNLPPKNVLNRIINRMAEDLDVIRAAMSQRKNLALCVSLEEADKLAICSLQLAIKNELIGANQDDVTVITYYRQSPNVRVIPYAAVVFIGIPYTSTQTKQDLLAIPHEVGHYVFWKTPVQQLVQAYLDSDKVPAYIKNWAEEIFADVYGCMVAGVAVALDFQDLFLRRYATDDLNKDDGEHPNTVIRPYIYIRTFRNQGQSGWASFAERRWETKLAERNVRYKMDRDPHLFVGELPDGQESLSRSEILADNSPLFQIVDSILNFIVRKPLDGCFADLNNGLSVLFQNKDQTTISPDDRLESEIFKLFEGINPVPAESKGMGKIYSWGEFIDLVNSEYFKNDGTSKEFLDAWKFPSTMIWPTEKPRFLSKNWQIVLKGDGWVTKGPWSKR
jgi:hypothetical protein